MATNENDGALAAFRRYTDAFQTLDPQAVIPHFHQPALFISPQGILALSSAADVERMYRPVMAELPARGYARTDFSQLVEERLGPDLALIRGVGSWRKGSGEEISRFGMSYTLVRAEGSWRIVVAAVHDPVAGGAR